MWHGKKSSVEDLWKWPSLQSHGFAIFRQASNTFYPQNIVNDFLFFSHLTIEKKEHGSVC